MALTELQNNRIAFHLDYVRPGNLLELDRDISVLTLTDNQILQVVGKPYTDGLSYPTDDDMVFFEGDPLATKTSALGRVELAFNNLSPDVISDTLFVKKAGKVELRKDELKARNRLYKELVSQLNQLVGGSDKYDRVGFNG